MIAVLKGYRTKDPVGIKQNFTQELIRFVQHLFIVMNDGATGAAAIDIRRCTQNRDWHCTIRTLHCVLVVHLFRLKRVTVAIAVSRVTRHCCTAPSRRGLLRALRQIPDLAFVPDDCPGIGSSVLACASVGD
jgi:hypothetical protein